MKIYFIFYTIYIKRGRDVFFKIWYLDGYNGNRDGINIFLFLKLFVSHSR